MKKKVFLFMCLTSLTAILLSCALTILVCSDDYFTRMKSQLRNEAVILTKALEHGGHDYLSVLSDLSDLSGTGNRITLIDDSGTVLFDNRFHIEQMENHLDRTEVKAALESGSGESARFSETLLKKTYYYALLLKNGDILRIAYTQNTFFAPVSGILPWLLLIAFFVYLLSILTARILTARIVKPINTLIPDNPESNRIYEELTPLLSKINQQNAQIERQMQSLREKQREFTAITENMSEGFLVIDRNTDILSFNSGALRLLNTSAPPPKRSVFTLNRGEAFRRAVDLALGGTKNEQIVHVNSLHYQIIANPVFSNDQLIGAVLMIMDVTEKEERENLRREFSANVSHELKTPLTAISGFSEIIRDKLVKPEDISRFAGNIYTEAQRLIALINDIIKLSQLDEGSLSGQTESVDLFLLAETVIRHLQTAAEKNNVTVSLSGGPVKVTGVYSILQEMITNLCDNAIKYNKDGGAVTVTVFDNTESFGISVADTGIGIPRDQINRVFERFYRIDKSHAKEIDGTGLGLSIVKHGAIYHKAAVTLDSVMGVGTTAMVKWEK